ncbi:MAG TPA: amino acid permease [Candidatus Binatia bacterium]|jgi:APA family basic amino acid/polyamine antiporter|nr:amino acid permease [Candidatus Binatia bacterium]
MLPTQLFRRKSLDKLVGETTDPQRQLRRVLGPVQLTMLGVGAIVGAGIFSTAGTAAAGGGEHIGAGPALVISFLMVAVACGFAALCYSEFAAMVPVSGSAYTYAYATLGELAAWLIGWDLILEYAISNAAVAVSWSAYFQTLLAAFHLHVPSWLGTDFRSAVQAAAQVAAAADPSKLDPSVLHDALALRQAPHLFGLAIVFNLPAFGIVALVTWIVLIGIRETAGFNTGLVVLKLVIIAFFLILGAMYVRPENWTPFAPNGFKGISSAAAIIFFAYIGFDAVSTAAEETRNPQRDMPIGILSSLVICTFLYVAVAIVLTGMAKWNTLGNAEPLAYVFSSLGMNWTASIIALGAVIATTSALVPYQAGQPRIFFAMGRDGLLPAWAAKVHPRFRTPHVTTIITGIVVAVCSSVANINELVELTNIGTLFAFVLVAAGIIILRYKEPERPRPFRTPFVPWVPLGAIACCGYLMSELPSITWIRFFLWMVAGLILYFCYGFRRSRLAETST